MMFQKGDLVKANDTSYLLQNKFYVVTRSVPENAREKEDFHWCEVISLDTGTHYEMPNRYFELVKRGNNAQPA